MFKNYTEDEFNKLFVNKSEISHYIIKDLKTNKYISLWYPNVISLTDKETAAYEFASKATAMQFIDERDLMSRDKDNFEIVPVYE